MKLKVGDLVWDLTSGEEYREKAVIVSINEDKDITWPIRVRFLGAEGEYGIGEESEFSLVLNGLQYLKKRHNL